MPMRAATSAQGAPAMLGDVVGDMISAKASKAAPCVVLSATDLTICMPRFPIPKAQHGQRPDQPVGLVIADPHWLGRGREPTCFLIVLTPPHQPVLHAQATETVLPGIVPREGLCPWSSYGPMVRHSVVSRPCQSCLSRCALRAPPSSLPS